MGRSLDSSHIQNDFEKTVAKESQHIIDHVERGESTRIRIVFLLSFLICLALTKTYVSYAGNEAGRFAMVESLVERSTFIIDDSPFVWTPDKAKVGDHFYCDKPPLMPVIGAAIGEVLKIIFSVTYETHPKVWVYWITALSVGLCAAWLIAMFFADTLRVWAIDDIKARIIYTGAAYAGTLVIVYSGTYTNHVPAAAFLYAGFRKFVYLSLSTNTAKSNRLLALCGFYTGMAWAMDHLVGTVFILAFAFALTFMKIRRRSTQSIFTFLFMASIPIFITALINLIMVGDPRPVYLLPGVYNYDGSYFSGGGAAGTFSPGDPLMYAVHILFGSRSIFLYSPILIPAALAMIWRMRHGDPWMKFAVVTISAASVIVLAIYILSTNNYGGWAYGFRYFSPVMPIWVFFLGKRWLFSSWWRKRIFSAVLIFSIMLSMLGSFNPWPICDEGQKLDQLEETVPTSPFIANVFVLKAFLDPENPPDAFFVNRYFDGDRFDAEIYLGKSFLSRSDIDRAELTIRRAYEINPTDPEVNILFKAVTSMAKEQAK